MDPVFTAWTVTATLRGLAGSRKERPGWSDPELEAGVGPRGGGRGHVPPDTKESPQPGFSRNDTTLFSKLNNQHCTRPLVACFTDTVTGI